MTGELVLTFFLVFLNGFFVAAEFAIVKVRSSQLEVMTNRSKALANAARSVVANLDSYLAATQLGITLASLGLGWVGEEVFSSLMMRTVHFFNGSLSEETAHRFAAPLAFVIITVLHIVFGELAPKSVAIRYPTRTTLFTALPLRLFYFVFRPFIWMLNGLANLLLRMVGIRTVHGAEIHSEEELKLLITESHEGGAIEETERELIQNVFDFDDRLVGQILTPRKNITAIEASTSLTEAAEYAFSQGYTRYPVYHEHLEDIRGIVHTKDIMRQVMQQAGAQTVASLMREPLFVADNRRIKDVLRLLQLRKLQMAIVTNEVGEIAGLVTMEDILEELVGEIQDEYDDEKPCVQPGVNNTFVVDAHCNLVDINKTLPYEIAEDEHYETLSGYISYHHPEELKKGDVLTIGEYQAVVLSMYRNSAASIELAVVE